VTARHRILLLRHAKSSWDDPGLPDDQRPLAPRGERAAELIGQRLRATRPALDLVLCSPAVRTRQTWQRVAFGLPAGLPVRYEPAIYQAPAAGLLALVGGLAEATGGVLVIGHNPGLAELAAGLAGDGDPAAISLLRLGFPTGALVTLAFAGRWAELAWGSAVLDSLVRPRDLDG